MMKLKAYFYARAPVMYTQFSNLGLSGKQGKLLFLVAIAESSVISLLYLMFCALNVGLYTAGGEVFGLIDLHRSGTIISLP